MSVSDDELFNAPDRTGEGSSASFSQLFYENDRALEQFQQARRNPQRKLASIIYLGRCLFEKGQYDMAIDQYDTALAEMLVMDKSKMQALYYKGAALDATGKADEAFDCYKQIYSVDVGFLDVAKKVDAYYAAKKA